MKKQPAISCRAVWQTSIGPLAGAATVRGICELRFPPPADLRLPPSLVGDVIREEWPVSEETTRPALDHLERLESYLRAYFLGELAELPALDDSGLSIFAQRVRRAACGIPAGSTTTYGSLARLAGAARAARAVGSVMSGNRTVLLMPCHRVLPAGGSDLAPGQFGGGTKLKSSLLLHEQGFTDRARRSGSPRQRHAAALR